MIIKNPHSNTTKYMYMTSNDFKYFTEKENVLINLKNHYVNLLISNEENKQQEPKIKSTKAKSKPEKEKISKGKKLYFIIKIK